MPDNGGGEKKILGMPRKTAWWVIGGAAVLVVVLLLFRPKGGAAPAYAGAVGAETELPGSPGYAGSPQGLLDRQQQVEAEYAEKFLGLSFQVAEREAGLAQAQLGYETQQYQFAGEQVAADRELYQRLASKKGGRKCPRGKMHIDPTTREVYCREEQHKGTLREAGKAIEKFFRPTSRLVSEELLPRYVAGYAGSVSRPRARQGSGDRTAGPSTYYSADLGQYLA